MSRTDDVFSLKISPTIMILVSASSFSFVGLVIESEKYRVRPTRYGVYLEYSSDPGWTSTGWTLSISLRAGPGSRQQNQKLHWQNSMETEGRSGGAPMGTKWGTIPSLSQDTKRREGQNSALAFSLRDFRPLSTRRQKGIGEGRGIPSLPLINSCSSLKRVSQGEWGGGREGVWPSSSPDHGEKNPML